MAIRSRSLPDVYFMEVVREELEMLKEHLHRGEVPRDLLDDVRVTIATYEQSLSEWQNSYRTVGKNQAHDEHEPKSRTGKLKLGA